MKRWEIAKLDKTLSESLSEKYDFTSFFSQLLCIRGITGDKEIQEFLSNDEQLSNPFIMKDMDKAVVRIHKAVNCFEKIAIYGDYDADGVTATSILYSYLASFGANIMFYIPSRDSEGYGLNIGAIEKLHNQGVKLIITVDNGVSAVEEIAYAKSLDIDVVVTDHHQPPSVLPDAVAIVDPHREDCPSKYKDLAGVGVALKLIIALEGEDADVDFIMESYADLVALGTIGDVMPLTGENRIIVKRGLAQLNQSDRQGIISLMEHAGIYGKKITASTVSFTIIPRLNAAGRMGSPDRAVKLLLSEEEEEVIRMTEEISSENVLRQSLEAKIIKEIRQQFQENPELVQQRILVVDGKDWHHGIIGIVASRLVERYGRPCIVISSDGEIAKGSGRSLRGFSLYDAICFCSDLLTRYGGHPLAAGINLKSEDINQFRKRINEYAKTIDEMPIPTLSLDCKLRPSYVNLDLVKQICRMEPFGSGNPLPVFGIYQVVIQDIQPLKGGKHLRISFIRDKVMFKGMRFGVTLEEFAYKKGDKVDIAVTLDSSEYRGSEYLSILIKDIRYSDMDIDKMIYEYRIFEKFVRNEQLTIEEINLLLPKREEAGVLYRYLRICKKWKGSFDVLYQNISNQLGFGKMLSSFLALNELNFIRYKNDGDYIELEINETAPNQSLDNSATIIRLKQYLKGVDA